MADFQGIYKCELCGNIVEVEHSGGGVLVCCGQDMTQMEEKTADSTTEKHVPIIERDGDNVKVTVGCTLHPMADEHYIEWIEVSCGDVTQKKYLKPGGEPFAEFLFSSELLENEIVAREYCNVHGLWSSK